MKSPRIIIAGGGPVGVISALAFPRLRSARASRTRLGAPESWIWRGWRGAVSFGASLFMLRRESRAAH